MATKAVAEIFRGHANVFVAAVGAEPTTPVGYTSEDGVDVGYSKVLDLHRVDEFAGPVISELIEEDLKAAFNLEQATAELLALAHGVAEAGNIVTLGNQTQVQKAIKIVGTQQSGVNLQLKLLQCVFSGSPTINIQRRVRSGIPLEATALINETAGNFGAWTFGTPTNQEQTISGGVLTRIADEGYHVVLGEGAAADDLDSITGAGLVNGETLRIQIKAVAQAITLKYLLGTLELDGAVDWTMDNLDDYIDLQYDLAGTKWVEIARYNA